MLLLSHVLFLKIPSQKYITLKYYITYAIYMGNAFFDIQKSAYYRESVSFHIHIYNPEIVFKGPADYKWT